MELTNKNVFVTGSSRGIGFGHAISLLVLVLMWC